MLFAHIYDNIARWSNNLPFDYVLFDYPQFGSNANSQT